MDLASSTNPRKAKSPQVATDPHHDKPNAFQNVEYPASTDLDKDFLQRSHSLFASAFKTYEPCSEPYVESPYVAPPLYDFLGVNDFYSFKNLEANCDVSN